MKKLVLLAALCFASTLVRGGNPIFEGWYADPEGMILGERYWVFPTYSARYEDQVFLDAFSSPDLVTWTRHPRVVDNTAVKWVWQAMWAPAVVEKEGRYFLFFGGNDIQNNDQPGGIGVAVADRPEGPYADYLGRPLIDRIVNGAQPIDQYVFRDADGTWYMFYGGWGKCNVVRLNDDFTGIEPFPDGELYKDVTPEGYVEGPFMFIRNGKYYFMWSEGGWTGPNYKVAYAIADSPLGPFVRQQTVLEQDTEIAVGAGHHSVIHEPRSDKYYMVYHRRPVEANGRRDSREVCIDEMRFDDRGHILPVVMTVQGVAANPL